MARFGRKSGEEKVKLEKGAFKRALRVFKFIGPYKGVFIIGLFLFSPFLVLQLYGLPVHGWRAIWDKRPF